MRPLWYPNRQERVIAAIKNIVGWIVTVAVFAGIGALLALGV